jgi:hypothetical protein
MKKTSLLITILLAISLSGIAQLVKVSESTSDNIIAVTLQNDMVRNTIVIKDSLLFEDTLQSLADWSNIYSYRKPAYLITDADFTLDVVYTALRAPGKDYNADNPVSFTKSNFRFEKYSVNNSKKNEKSVDFWFSGTNNPFTLKLTYALKANEFFARRKITLTDESLTGHYLDKIHTRKGRFAFYTSGNNVNTQSSFTIHLDGYTSSGIIDETSNPASDYTIINKGDFGQPVAIKNEISGAFGGIEYPTSVNHIQPGKIDFFQYLGEQIKAAPVSGEWAVLGITPEPYVKKWFFQYVKAIRVAPANPYTMYNSWYDLRSPVYPDVPENAVMNEENVTRIWNLVKENFIEKNKIKIDAFVLDDGWDIYESDWKLRDKQFPNGMRPIADELEKSGSDLGIWFGPMGGYSFALKRIQWMHDHGYEVTGNLNKYESAKLCLAGKNYSKLFRKRITDFVNNDHVGYFKWDGIQFSCSEPNHGHPVGIHSRRAIMESVIDKCNAVRAINPDVYLNITTGTWLSPWWVKYANQIWMDAEDYAFADVPSMTRRDNAMTYRDYGLFDDEHIRKSWFPISNLMIHGIIKGKLENISKEGETLETFTNNAVLYFARGISMWELYISPDILTDGEWNALSASIKWANNRFKILSQTFMVGGNPANGNTYGYLHFSGDKGIIAVRNPKVDDDRINIVLNPEYGINEKASGLIIEQVYPKRYIFPQTYAAGSRLSIPLDGFETAIFEVHPLSCKSGIPLVAGIPFKREMINNEIVYTFYGNAKVVKVLNPEIIKRITVNGEEVPFNQLNKQLPESVAVPEFVSTTVHKKDKTTIALKTSSTEGTEQVAVLLKNGKKNQKKDFPEVSIFLNGKKLAVKTQAIEGQWMWYTALIPADEKPDVQFSIKNSSWKGTAEVWVRTSVKENEVKIAIQPTGQIHEQTMPPLPYKSYLFKNYNKIVSIEL